MERGTIHWRSLSPALSTSRAIELESLSLTNITRELDLEAELWGEVFEPLRDVNLFRQVRFDPDSETVVWPNGADLAPEFLRWGEHLDENCPCGH